MDSGVKRLRSEADGEIDDDEESDDSIGVVSAAYKLENKIPVPDDVESSLPSKKRGRTSPPRQGSFLSSNQMKERFGTADLSDSGDESIVPDDCIELDLEEVNKSVFYQCYQSLVSR